MYPGTSGWNQRSCPATITFPSPAPNRDPVCEYVFPPPDGLVRYRAALYETRGDYFQAGGPQNSGGVYMSGEKIFKVPFPSLGLTKRGKTYFKNDYWKNNFNSLVQSHRHYVCTLQCSMPTLTPTIVVAV